MIITVEQFIVFSLIFARFAGLVAIAPFFSMKSIFSLGKLALVFWSSALVLFVVPLPAALPDAGPALVFAVVVDFLVGLSIGFISQLIITSVSFGGTLMDTQAGLSSAATLDPISGANSSLLEQLMQWIAVILFLLINGHHLLIQAVFKSFSVIPLGTPIQFDQGADYIVSLGASIFSIGFQLAAPIILVVFIIDFCFGILNKVAEQVNVFQLGFQVKPIISVFIFLGIAPGFFYVLVKIVENSLRHIIKVLALLGT